MKGFLNSGTPISISMESNEMFKCADQTAHGSQRGIQDQTKILILAVYHPEPERKTPDSEGQLRG